MDDSSRADSGPDAPQDPRPVRRRSLALGGAWAAPVALSSVAVPAYAVSAACTHHTDQLPGLFTNAKVYFMTFGDTDVQANFSYSTNRTLSSQTGHVPGPTPHFLRLQHATGPAQGDWEKLEIDFVGAVTNPTLTLTRIDRVPDKYDDQVLVGPSGFVVTNRGANIAGAGTEANRFHSTGTTADTGATSEVTVTWPGTFPQGKRFSITYYAADAKNELKVGQDIGVRNIGFDLCT